MNKRTFTAGLLVLALGATAQAETVNGIWFGAEVDGMCDVANNKQRDKTKFKTTSEALMWLSSMQQSLEDANMMVGPLNLEYAVKPAGHVVLEAGKLTNEVAREIGEDLVQGWKILSKAGLCGVEQVGRLHLPQTVNCAVEMGGNIVVWAPDVVGDYTVDGLNTVESITVAVLDRGLSDGLKSIDYELYGRGPIGKAAALPFAVASYTVDTGSGVIKGAVREVAIPTTNAVVDGVAMTACTPFSGVSDMLHGKIGEGVMKTTFGTVSTAAFHSYKIAEAAIVGSYNVTMSAASRVFMPIHDAGKWIIENGDKTAHTPSYFSPTEINSKR